MGSILFVSLMNGAAWGGSEQLWYHAAIVARQQGHSVGVLCYYWPEKLEKLEALKMHGIQVWEIPGANRKQLSSFRKLRFDFFTKPKQSKWIRNFDYSAFDAVVISQGGSNEVCHGPWKKLWQKMPPYLLLFQSYSEQFDQSETKKSVLLKWMRHARQNLLVTARIAEVLKKHGSGFASIHWATLVNPVTVPVNSTPPIFPPVEDETFVLGMVATMDFERKAQDKLLQVLATPKWLQRPWYLWLYGAGRDAARAAELVKILGLSQKVGLPGHTNDMVKALEPIHLMLHITQQEGMPIVVMDAMAMGKPVVVSNVGDMPQWISEGENGWIAENTNNEEIDRVLELAWQHRSRWAAMGQLSFEIFKSKYDKHPGQHLLSFLKLS